MQYEEIEELRDDAICADCVGEIFLSGEIQAEGTERTCRYCGEVRMSYTLGEMAARVEAAFNEHYSHTDREPDALQWMALKDPESDYEFEREGEPTADAIMNAADIPTEAAGDIQAIIADAHSDFDSDAMGEETPFSSDAQYQEKMPDGREWQESWRSFERTIRAEARFFSRTAANQLAALFDDIDQMRTLEGHSLIVDAGPETKLRHLFRARVFQSDDQLTKALGRPDLYLAAPPSELASAGRMNAKGISTFYGATDPNIALAEVRPPVGSQVAIARFDLIRPLRLLDLNALEQVHEKGSIFDPTYAPRLGRMMFLKSLSRRMARPVMPDDQDFQYLATQAIADYLATEGKVPLDGIMFPSVQAGSKGVNIVLFHKASRCEEMDIPEGTEIEASTFQDYEDGPETEYTVIERVPPSEPEKPESDDILDTAWLNWKAGKPTGDARDNTLRVVPKTIRVHIIDAVNFETTEYSVARLRWPKQDPLKLPF